jgi:hypothetical protein
MRKSVVLISITLFAFTSFLRGQNLPKAPRFQDFPVSDVYKGKNARLKLARYDRSYRTRLKWAVESQKPDFAGRYIVTAWGCGTSCIQGALIDAETGRVSWWPIVLCCWSGEKTEVSNGFSLAGNLVEFRQDSRLIAFYGESTGEQGNTHGIHYYKVENGRFILVRFIPIPKE